LGAEAAGEILVRFELMRRPAMRATARFSCGRRSSRGAGARRKRMTATGKEAEKERGGTRVLFIRWKGKQCARKLGRHSKD
jgi:hypothetical protein